MKTRETFQIKQAFALLFSFLFLISCFIVYIPTAYAGDELPSSDTAAPAEQPAPSDPPAVSEPVSSPQASPSASLAQDAIQPSPDIITEPDGTQYADGEVIVKFKKSTSSSAISSTLDAVDSEIQQNMNGAVVAQVPDGESVESFIDTLKDQPNVAFAQPNYLYHFDRTVNDPLVDSQWHLGRIGVPEAWDITMGTPSVKVAILDTGIDLTLPEFSGQIYAQADTVTNDGNAQDDSNAYYCYGHGTHVAGIIAGKADNSVGIAGVAPGVSLIPVDVFDGDGAWSTDIVEGIQFAAANGADVINMSFGGSGSDSYLEWAINNAVSAGVVCVAAAGNENTDAYCHPSDFNSVISVIATTSVDTRAYFSNYGDLKDISAPGMSILSTVPGGDYEFWSGTSMASPVVAGVVALLRSAKPDLTVNEIKDILYSTAVDLGDTGKDIYFANGRVNAYAALSKVLEDPVVQYTVSVSANNASYGRVSGGGIYNVGDTATLSAVPNAGCRFLRWSENGSEVSTALNYSFTVTNDVAMTAEFAALTPISLNCSQTDVTTAGGSDGTITAEASGGDSGTYEFAMGSGAWGTSDDFVNLAAGTYTISARDAAYPENMASLTVTISQPSSYPQVSAYNLPSRVNAGDALTIIPPSPPYGYAAQRVSFTSSNPSVAPVDENGNLTFVRGGRATITTAVYSQMTDSRGRVRYKTTMVRRTITVTEMVTSITLNMTDTSIVRSQRIVLTAGIAPASASNKRVNWSSSNPAAAIVSPSGVVTGRALGTAVITCTARDGSGVSASCTVHVTPIYPTGVKISKTALSVKKGRTAVLTSTVSPRNTELKAVIWTSSNPGVATVDLRGKVRGVSPGTAVITATTGNGLAVACTVTVR